MIHDLFVTIPKPPLWIRLWYNSNHAHWSITNAIWSIKKFKSKKHFKIQYKIIKHKLWFYFIASQIDFPILSSQKHFMTFLNNFKSQRFHLQILYFYYILELIQQLKSNTSLVQTINFLMKLILLFNSITNYENF